MGVCGSKQVIRQKPQEATTKPVAQNPAAPTIPVHENDRTIKRTFTVILSNVKIKNPPQKQGAQLILHFDGIRKQFPLTEIDGTLRWKQQTEFEYTVDDYHLKTTAHARLCLSNSSEADLGSLNIKLYQVATGPYHHDMAVMWKSQLTAQKIAHMKSLNIPIKENLEGRISFDLKMFQKIEFCITADEITSYLDHFTDKAYNFSFRLITHNNNYNSSHSENFLNPAFQKNKKSSNQGDNSLADQSSQDENSSMNSQKNKLNTIPKKPVELNDSVDENFNNAMEENVEAKKIQSKLARNNLVNSSHNLDGQNGAQAINSSRQRDPRQSVIADAKRTGGTIIRKGTKRGTFVRNSETPQNGDSTPTHLNSASLIASENTDLVENEDFSKEDQASQEKELHELNWDYKNIINQEGFYPPELIVKLTTRDLATTSLQICFWGLLSTEPLERKDEQGNIIKYMDNHIAGECYVSLNRIFALQPEIIEAQGQKVQVRKKVVQEKLWNHGKEVGNTISHFKVINHEYLQQMIVGVQTENGIFKASPAVYNFKENTSASNVDIQALNTAKNTLNDSVFALYEEKSVVNQQDKEKVQLAIQKSFSTIFQIAQKSDKESVKSFYYKSQEDLLQSQDILIDIAKQLLQYADDVEDALRDNFYDCLKIIINRGEFDLNYMGFDDSYIYLLDNAQGAHIKKNNLNKENLKKLSLKMKVALSYQKLLYNVLEKVLDKLNQKALSDKERQFVENYLAVAYFRIPEFREKLLSVIVRPDDIEITEWRGTEYQLDEKKNSKLARNNEFISLFDWEYGFYRFLKTQERGEQHFSELNAVLNENKWSQRLSKRGVAFFFFLTEWLQYVNKTVVVKDHVPWQDLPGYLTLLRVFLIELKQRDLLQYPEAMKQSSSNFLNNERLLNILTTLIFNKTNVYDSEKTLSALDLINSWMKFLSHHNKNIPTVFDFNFFFKGIRLILEQDHSACLSRAIWLIYNNFQLFPHDFQREICEYLFSNLFFKLFLHWSFNVRMIFQCFLMYRIHHLYQEPKTKYKSIDELKRQLNNNTNQSERKFALIHDLIILLNKRMMNIIDIARQKYSFQESRRHKEQQFHLKMRNKLLEKQQQKFFQNMSVKNNSTSNQSILEISFSQETRRVQQESKDSKNILDDLNDDQNQRGFTQQDDIQEKDMLLDSFDNFEIEQIQRAQSTISQIAQIQKPIISNQEQIFQQEDNNYDVISADEPNENEENPQEGERRDSAGRKESISEAKNQVVIYNRKMAYQVEKNDEELIQMEKQYLKYIVQACVEHEIVKSEYEKWVNLKLSQLPSMTKEKKNLHMRKFAIPEVNLKATIDESEASYTQVDEW